MKFFIPCIFWLLYDFTDSNSISTVGFNLLEASPTFFQTGLSGTTNGTVYLLPDAVTDYGLLFAFSVFVYNQNPVTFQIYRQNEINANFELLANILFLPSVIRERENVYIEALFGQTCVRVKPGDRLALLFQFDPPSVVYEFVGLKSTVMKGHSSSSVGEIVKFDALGFPYSFYAEAFIFSDNSSHSNDTDCIHGVVIPQDQIIQPTRSTFLPITGAAGHKGQIGEIGLKGASGSIGEKGNNGSTGRDGKTGVKGSTGNPGEQGPRGVQGSNGSDGHSGEFGNDGTMGSTGEIGVFGPIGTSGNSGADVRVYLKAENDPNVAESAEDDEIIYWMKDNAITSIFIWLAVISIVTVISFILILMLCCFCYCNESHKELSPLSKNSVHGSSDYILDGSK